MPKIVVKISVAPGSPQPWPQRGGALRTDALIGWNGVSIDWIAMGYPDPYEAAIKAFTDQLVMAITLKVNLQNRR